MRCWSQDTLLNGKEFVDAVVSPGDCLQVGSAVFEVMDLNAASGDADTGQTLEIRDEPGASLRETTLRLWQQDSQRREGCALNRGRARRLLQELRTCRAQLRTMSELTDGPTDSVADVEDQVPESEELIIERAATAQRDAEAQESSPSSPPEADEILFESISAEAPVTAIGLLERLGMTTAEQQDGDDEDEAEEANRPLRKFVLPAAESRESHTVGTSSGKTTEGGAGHETDASIDDYMAGLLERVGKKSRREEVVYQPHSPDSLGTKGADEAADVASEDKPEILTELPVRANRPAEQSVDMSAMRELAHLHTTSLLDLHFRKSFKRSTTGQGVVAACALVGGIVAAALSSELPIAFYLSILGFAVAIVCGWQWITSLWHLAFGGLSKRASATSARPGAVESSSAIELAMPPALVQSETVSAHPGMQPPMGGNKSGG
ncbi:MAG TPA: hypothetical protein VGG64_12820 [Pirellulales bacterium]